MKVGQSQAARRILSNSLLFLLASGNGFHAAPVKADPTKAAVDPASIAAPQLALSDRLAAVTRDPALQAVSWGAHALEVRSGKEIYTDRSDRSLLPASTMKVLTSAAALDALGPSYRFRTQVLVDGPLKGNGLLDGNLYFKGGGDPTLVLERLWKLVYDVRLEGVQEIRGNVVFDAGFFDGESLIPGWDKKLDIANGPSYFAPLGALSLNYNTVALVVGPGEKPGAQARVEPEIVTGLVEVQNRMRTGGATSRRWVRLERRVDGLKMKLSIAGSVPFESPAVRYYRAVADPTAYFTGAVATLCKLHGIRVKGRWVNGSTPTNARPLVHTDSQELLTILMDVNKHSNNFMTEQVLKTLGAEKGGLPGTTDKGLMVVADYLTRLGIPADSFQIVNGSGLSRRTRIQPRQLTRVLRDMYLNPRVGAEFRSSLSIGGRDGTLRSRFKEERESGLIRGKTGTLDGVHCLAGYVEALDGEVYAFAFLANDITGPVSRVRRAQTAFAETLFAGSTPPAEPRTEDAEPAGS